MVLTLRSHSDHPAFTYGTLTPCGRPFQWRSVDRCGPSERSVPRSGPVVLPPDSSAHRLDTLPGFGLLPFRSPLLRESSLFLRVLRCFSSPSAPHPLDGWYPRLTGMGCPIRIPLDHPMPARPQGLSWRGHVLPRQQAPRHPPCAHLRGSSLSFRAPCTPLPPRTTRPEPLRGRSQAPHTHISPIPQHARTHPAAGTGVPSSTAHSGLPGCALRSAGRSGAAGIRTPDLRRAKAALSQLSYDPPAGPGGRCGRAWTRTRDLGLIRTAL
jgi:hypothetical protein